MGGPRTPGWPVADGAALLRGPVPCRSVGLRCSHGDALSAIFTGDIGQGQLEILPAVHYESSTTPMEEIS